MGMSTRMVASSLLLGALASSETKEFLEEFAAPRGRSRGYVRPYWKVQRRMKAMLAQRPGRSGAKGEQRARKLARKAA